MSRFERPIKGVISKRFSIEKNPVSIVNQIAFLTETMKISIITKSDSKQYINLKSLNKMKRNKNLINFLLSQKCPKLSLTKLYMENVSFMDYIT